MTTGATLLFVEPLRPTDPGYGAVVEALEAGSLPADDLAELGGVFLRVLLDNGPVGYQGYDIHGKNALLLSLVVLPGLRGRGLGRQVVEAVLHAAAEAVSYPARLLTTKPGAFFERLGFARIARANASESIRSSRQDAGLCPSSAVLMTRRLHPKA